MNRGVCAHGRNYPLAATSVMRYNYSEWGSAWSFSTQNANYYISFNVKSEDRESPVGNFSFVDMTNSNSE